MKTVCRCALILTPLIFASCQSKLQFDNIPGLAKSELTLPSGESERLDDPRGEPPKDTRPLGATYLKTRGDCAPDSSTAVVSCIRCEVPPLPAVEPPMSLKARQLLQIMNEGCGIYNKSYSSTYIAPTAAAHLAKLNRCSPQAYRDTIPSPSQEDLLARLLDHDVALYQKMFGGLWYQPPYSDYFETYFGIEVREAVQVFCTQTNSNFTGNLYPIEWYHSENPDSFQLSQAYIDANNYRTDLKACIQESVMNPWQPEGPAPTQKVCRFETMEGASGEPIESQISAWLSQGYKVGAQIKNLGLCLEISDAAQIKPYHGEVVIGGYTCE